MKLKKLSGVAHKRGKGSKKVNFFLLLYVYLHFLFLFHFRFSLILIIEENTEKTIFFIDQLTFCRQFVEPWGQIEKNTKRKMALE